MNGTRCFGKRSAPPKSLFRTPTFNAGCFPAFWFYPITEHAILRFGLLCWGHAKTRSRFRGNPRKPETAREIMCSQCAVARRPRPGVNRTRSRPQERPKGAGTRPGGRLHDSHQGFLDPPRNPEMGRMRILSAGRRDLGRREWEMDESVVNSSNVGGSLHTNGPGSLLRYE